MHWNKHNFSVSFSTCLRLNSEAFLDLVVKLWKRIMSKVFIMIVISFGFFAFTFSKLLFRFVEIP